MNIFDKKEYYWKRTDSWQWDGKECWWEVYVSFRGMHGGGGAVIEERWRWNESKQNIRTQFRALTPLETNQLIKEIEEHAKENAETESR